MAKDRDETADENFLEKFGLTVATGEVKVGDDVPIYGMITKIISEVPGNVIVEINFSIEAHMFIDDLEKIQLLKERAFEPGIFVSHVKEKLLDKTIVECGTVVFGRPHQMMEN